MSSHSQTVAAALTPPGTGGIATMAIVGPRSWTIARELFHPRSSAVPTELEGTGVGQFWLGRFGEEMADEVILALKQKEPEPWVEVHCHGGQQILQYLLSLFSERGAIVSTWEEFQLRVTESPLQAHAAIAMAKARSTRAAAILLDQYQGALEQALQNILKLLNEKKLSPALTGIEAILEWRAAGLHLTEPWRVVLAGAPNVGKSSLMNAIAGYQRAVVSPMPGTTRDLVTTTVAIDGWLVDLVDTAGARQSDEALEQQGILRSQEMIAEADLCLWLVEAQAEPQWPELPIQPLLVINKIDLDPVWDLSTAETAITVSATNGNNLDHLCQKISQRLVPVAPPPGAAVPFTPEIIWKIDQIKKACEDQKPHQASTLLHSLLEEGP